MGKRVVAIVYDVVYSIVCCILRLCVYRISNDHLHSIIFTTLSQCLSIYLCMFQLLEKAESEFCLLVYTESVV